MKTTCALFIYAMLLTVTVSAQPSHTKDTITITGTRFTFPLVQEWINTYQQTNPQIVFRLVSPRDAAAANADVHFTAQRVAPEQHKTTHIYTPVARYALLPVANTHSRYAGHPLNVTALRTLFFQNGAAQQDDPAEKTVVYNRLEKSCAPVTFAAFYGSSFEDIKGQRVPGDDQHLLKAVQDDPAAISFNNPGFIYDLSTRKPVHDIAVIPLDLNDNGKLDADEDFYTDLDVLLRRLETAPPAGIPVEGVTLFYNRNLEKSKPVIKEWVQYIQEQGQQQLHAYGFLQPAPAKLAASNNR